MVGRSAIEWTDLTWNPATGCTKVSPGCENCYAERMAKRLQAMGQPNYVNGFRLALHEHVLHAPLAWKKPRVVFVNSMSDLFHKDVPVKFVLQVFDVMNRANWHQFQILTKRSDRLAQLNDLLPWAPHIWPMDKEWVIDIRDQCLREGTPFFFKQWGGVNKKKTGRLLDRRTWDQMPTPYAV